MLIAIGIFTITLVPRKLIFLRNAYSRIPNDQAVVNKISEDEFSKTINSYDVD